MGESRLIVEELLTKCLQRITMEESTRKTELGESCWGSLRSTAGIFLHQGSAFDSFRDD